jgi:predicted acetyltransferase
LLNKSLSIGGILFDQSFQLMKVENVKIKESEEIFSFLYECFFETYKFIPEEKLNSFFNTLFGNEKLLNSIKKNFFLTLKNDGNEIIGVLDAYVDENDSYCTINSFYIKPSEQNKGYGKLLIKEMLNKISKLKIDRVWIGIFVENTKSLQIYQKHGYIENKKSKIEIENQMFDYSTGYFTSKHLISIFK